MRAELRRLVVLEGAAELAERRAEGGDDDGAGHAGRLAREVGVGPEPRGERDEHLHAGLDVVELAISPGECMCRNGIETTPVGTPARLTTTASASVCERPVETSTRARFLPPRPSP